MARASKTSPSAFDSRRYRAEDALATLTRADEHRKDKTLMRHVHKLAKEKMTTLAKVVIKTPAKGKRNG